MDLRRNLPGAYSSASSTSNASPYVGGRVGAIIGKANPIKKALDTPVIRGSSSELPIKVQEEDLTSQINGVTRVFYVANLPVVSEDLSVSNNTNDIRVFHNGQPIPASSLVGSSGKITLVTIPQDGDTLTVAYFYKKTDVKAFEDYLFGEDMLEIKVQHPPITTGDGSGTVTDSTEDIIVRVNGVVSSLVESIDGASGVISFASAIPSGASVEVEYYYNPYINGYDVLPHEPVGPIKVGDYANSPKYVYGEDYLFRGNKIVWGNGVIIENLIVNDGNPSFDETKISTSVVDFKVYKEVANRVQDDVFSLSYVPSLNGLPSESLMQIEAEGSLGTSVEIYGVDIETKTLKLVNSLPTGEELLVTYNTSLIQDGEYTLEVTDESLGKYQVKNTILNTLLPRIEFNGGGSSVSDALFTGDLPFPDDGVSGVFLSHTAGNDTISVNFSSATEFEVVSSELGSLGSGELGKIFNSNNGLLLLQLLNPTEVSLPYTFADGDVLEFSITEGADFEAGEWYSGIPGIVFRVIDTLAGDGAKASLEVCHFTGREPSIGDQYYVSYQYDRENYEPVRFSNGDYAESGSILQAIEEEFGSLSPENDLVIGAYLAIMNNLTDVFLVPTSNTSDTAFFNAVEKLEGKHVDAIVGLRASRTAYGSLVSHASLMSSIDYRKERRVIMGFTENLSVADLVSERQKWSSDLLQVIPNSWMLLELYGPRGKAKEYLFDGTFVACAYLGADLSPERDEATPLVNKKLYGIKRIREFTTPEQTRLHNSEYTVLTNSGDSINIETAWNFYNQDEDFKAPWVVKTSHAIQRRLRTGIERKYKGTKNFGKATGENIKRDVVTALDAMRNSYLVDYRDVKVFGSSDNVRQWNISLQYKPIDANLWFNFSLTLNSRLS